MLIHRCSAPDVDLVLRAGYLFEYPPQQSLVREFLSRPGHHLLIAMDGDMPVGFVSGIEVCHPDKRVEMLLYELSVAETHRRRGIGRGLVEELLALAADIGCRGMWVPLDSDNEAAIATYRSARADETETSLIMSWDLEAPAGRR